MSAHLHNIKWCEIFCSNCVALNHTQLDYIDPKLHKILDIKSRRDIFVKRYYDT